MAKSAFLLLSFVVCLYFVHGAPPWLELLNGNQPSPALEDGDNPQTIDQILGEASDGNNPMRRELSSEDMFIDGDMVISRNQYEGLFGKKQRRSYKKDPFITLWTNGEIVYEIMPGHFDERQTNKIKQAMRTWQELTCLTFREARDDDTVKIQIMNTGGCWSILGMATSGPQKMTFGSDCFWRGTVEHEFGHAIGLVHEHQRPERDTYLFIDRHNIKSGFEDSLNRYRDGAVDKMGVPYDYYSVMHYSARVNSKDFESVTMHAYDKNTGTRLPEITEKLGKAQGPSFYDVKLVNLMYKCSARCSPMPRCRSSDCFVDRFCQCVCKDNLRPLPCEDLQRDCQSVKESGDCYFPELVQGTDYYCKKTCGWCNEGNSRLPPAEINLPDGPCFDKRTECQIWFEMGECERNPDALYRNCMKTCGRCPGGGGNRPPTPRPPQRTTPPPRQDCMDTNDLCDGWAQLGYCDQSAVREVCKLSCNLCGNGGGPSRPDNSDCMDTNDLCDGWAQLGYCDQSAVRKVCELSCNLCGNGGGPSRPDNSDCMDTSDLCDGWAQLGYCDQSAVRKVCELTCNQCGNGGGPSRPDNSDCMDINILCESWATLGYCNQSAVREVCRRTCGVC